jgi:hypothetical protein
LTPTETARFRKATLGALCALGVTAWSGCSNPPEDLPDGGQPPGVATCDRDTSEGPDTPLAYTQGNPATGYVCPIEDQDWYAVTVAPGDRILKVGLRLASPISPVEPTYTVWSTDASGQPAEAIAAPPSTQIGAALDDVHCVDSGDLLVAVRDSGDDAQDLRQAYTFTVTTSPDPDSQEPNDAQEAATALTAGQSRVGAIACRGDEDWYQIEIPDGNLIRMTLASEIADYEPTLRLLTAAGDVLVREENKSGTVRATAFDRFEVVPGPGTYFIVVSDDDGAGADPDVNYTLGVELVQDSDDNEPNNHPDEATELSADAVSCASERSFTATGTIGAPGDDDWFKLPLANCGDGILDVELEFNNAGLSDAEQWAFNNELQATVTVVKGHAESACDTDSTCSSLNLACNGSLDCAGVFEQCLPDNLCAGATVCLPEGVCGANVVQRRYECRPNLDECDPSGTPPPNRARVSMPLRNIPYVYLRVSDFQADGAEPGTTYTLRASVRNDPDLNEPSEVFTNSLRDEIPVRASQSIATEIPVHDATIGQGCDESKWVTGYLAYENDLDFYTYTHPCPGEDCTMRLRYDTQAGPVDFVVNIYRGSSLWFTAFDNEELANQAAFSGALGGLESGGLSGDGRCYYAYQGHTSNNGDFRYYVVVRDLFDLFSDDATIRPDSRDWDEGQRYRFCVEKVSNVCEEPPCQIYEDGCGQPTN